MDASSSEYSSSEEGRRTRFILCNDTDEKDILDTLKGNGSTETVNMRGFDGVVEAIVKKEI